MDTHDQSLSLAFRHLVKAPHSLTRSGIGTSMAPMLETRHRPLASLNRRGFTLQELLVVLAIVTVLAAILLPVISAARRSVYAAACASNEKQILSATAMYVEDYDEYYPPSIGLTPDNEIYTVYDLLLPYVKAPPIGICPAFPEGYNYNQVLQQYSLTISHPTSLSYVINAAVIADGCTNPLGAVLSPIPIAHSTTIEYVSEEPLLYDGWLSSSLDSVVDGRHNGATNVGYVDGHVKMMPLTHNTQLNPNLVDPITGKQEDEWLITSGPFSKQTADSSDGVPVGNFEFLGLLKTCEGQSDPSNTCSYVPSCGQ